MQHQITTLYHNLVGWQWIIMNIRSQNQLLTDSRSRQSHYLSLASEQVSSNIISVLNSLNNIIASNDKQP